MIVYSDSAGLQGSICSVKHRMCLFQMISHVIIRPAEIMGAIFFCTTPLTTFARIFCELFRIISAISGSVVLVMICNNYAKLFSGQNPSLLDCLLRMYSFDRFQALFQMKSPSRSSWFNPVLLLKQQIKH